MPESIQPGDAEKTPADVLLTLASSSNSSSNHPPKSDDSTTLIWKRNYSGRAFRTHFVILLLLTVGFVFCGFYWGNSWADKIGTLWMWLIVLAIPIVLWIRYTIIYFYNTITISYELTHDRLLSKKGLFYQTTDTTLILRINDVKLKQNLWDKYINGNVGTVVLYSSDTTDPELRLAYLYNPKEIFETIDKLVTEKTKRKAIKMLAGRYTDGDGDGDGEMM